MGDDKILFAHLNVMHIEHLTRNMNHNEFVIDFVELRINVTV